MVHPETVRGHNVQLYLWSFITCIPPAHYSVGAYADSAHEYFLKQWLLTYQSEPKAKDLCMIVF